MHRRVGGGGGGRFIGNPVIQEIPWYSRNLNFNELPEWMKDNEFILTGYRPPMPSFWSCTQSLFYLHNETISIWSHLVASILFARFYTKISESKDYSIIQNDLGLIKIYHLSAIFAFTCSFLYHLFLCYSSRIRDLFVKLDYIGITVFTTGSFMAWIYYAFHDASNNSIYIYAISLGGFVVAVLTQMDKFNRRDNRGQRAGLYIIFGISSILPAMILFRKSWNSERSPSILRGFFFTTSVYVTGGIIYSIRLPERFWPGRFDLVGHSHQLFHIIVAFASIMHERTILDIAIDNVKYGDMLSNEFISTLHHNYLQYYHYYPNHADNHHHQ